MLFRPFNLLKRWLLFACLLGVYAPLWANSLVVSHRNGTVGSVISVPVTLVHQSKLACLKFDLAFDHHTLEPTVPAAELSSEFFEVLSEVTQPGYLRVLLLPKSYPLPQNLTPITLALSFQVLPGATDGNYSLTPEAVELVDQAGALVALDESVAGSIEIRSENQVPIAQNGLLALDEDSVASGTFSASDSNGDNLRFSLAQQATKGTVYLPNPDSAHFTFVPFANAEGSDQFLFTAADFAGVSPAATVQVQINGRNDPPTAARLELATLEDSSARATPVVTDVDSGDHHQFNILSPADHGQAEFQAGQLYYLPENNYSGSDRVVFQATDQAGASIIGEALISVEAVNDPPISVSLSFELDEDEVADGTPIVADVDDNHHDFAIVEPPSFGSASVVGPQIRYRPAANFNGSDSFTFRATDSGLLSVEASAAATIRPVNDPPSSTSAVIRVCVESLSAAVTPDVSDIDLAREGDSFNFVILDQPSHGTAQILNNQLVYNAGSSSGADSFPFQAVDAAGAAVAGIADITILDFDGVQTASGLTLGLTPLILSASANCGSDNLNFQWQELPNGLIIGTTAEVVLDPAPTITTDYRVSVSDPGTGLSASALTRVLVHPFGLDLNGDGFNTIEDLWFTLPDWLSNASVYDADQDQLLTILDFLFIPISSP